jgi:uncharacterized protein YjbI with pentapeptide repeats
MNITCENCGGKNTLPKGKTSMFCAFCGTNIEAPTKQTKTKVSSSNKGSDKETILAYIKGGSKSKLDLPMADLVGIHLKDANLEGANLNGANLRDSFFGGAILKNANLRNTNLVNTKFKGADLSGADLSGAELYEEVDSDEGYKCVDFTGANLENVIIKNAYLGKIDFRGVKNLSGADFRGSSFGYARFNEVKMKGINLSGTDLNKAEFERSDLSNADLSNIISGREEDIVTGSEYKSGNHAHLVASKLCNANLKKAQLISAALYDVDFTGSDLSGADLRGASLSGAILNGAILTGADLRGALLIDVDLTKANLKGAKLEGAILKRPIQKKEGNCYLTTACTVAMNLPDDCHELQTLRKFRDGFVSETPEGRELIKEYYKIAPGIVEAVYDIGNGNEFFTELYYEIKKIVSMIDRKKNRGAFRYYCDMTERLKKQYLH